MKQLRFLSLEPSPIPHPDKEKILVFMRHGVVVAAAPGIPKDWLTGEQIGCEMITYAAFDFYWTSIDAWHFATYNLQLPEDFIAVAREHHLDHIRRRADIALKA